MWDTAENNIISSVSIWLNISFNRHDLDLDGGDPELYTDSEEEDDDDDDESLIDLDQFDSDEELLVDEN